MDESYQDKSLVVIEQRLLDEPTICKVRQTYIEKWINSLFKVLVIKFVERRQDKRVVFGDSAAIIPIFNSVPQGVVN